MTAAQLMELQQLKDLLQVWFPKGSEVLLGELADLIFPIYPLPPKEFLTGSAEAKAIFFELFEILEKHKQNILVARSELELLEVLITEVEKKQRSPTDEDKAAFNESLKLNIVKNSFTTTTLKSYYSKSEYNLVKERLQDIQKNTERHFSDPLINIFTSYNKIEPLKNLMIVLLKLHSKRYEQDLAAGGQVHIIHFYPSAEQPRQAEFLDAYDSDADEDNINHESHFVKTSHGLGSGVYGLGLLSFETIDEQVYDNSKFTISKIELPLHLDDRGSEDYTEISKGLQRIAGQAKKLQYQKKMSRADAINICIQNADKQLNKYAEMLQQLVPGDLELDITGNIIRKSLHEFFVTSSKKNYDILPMPINYVVSQLGFTGVVSKYNDSFNRGLINLALEDEGEEQLIKLPVKCAVPRPYSPTLFRAAQCPSPILVKDKLVGPKPISGLPAVL